MIPPMPVIVGAPRSGTTLLRFMIDAHPEIAIPPETGFLAGPLGAAAACSGQQFVDTITSFPVEAPAWQDFGISEKDFRDEIARLDRFSVSEGLRAFYRLYAARFGKRRWGDKTPMYCLHIETIAAVLPEAHFIHVIRDGRDVALSWRRTWFSPGNEIEALASQWMQLVTAARTQGARSRRYLEVRFETLILDPERVLAQICSFVGIPYDSAMLDYHAHSSQRLAEHLERRRPDGALIVSREQRLEQQRLVGLPPQRSRVQAWKQTMEAGERARFEHVAGNLLISLGYEV